MFQVHSKVIHLYKYTYIIFEIIFHHKLLQGIVIQGITRFPMLYSKPLLFVSYLFFNLASLIAQLVKNPPAMQETPVQFLGQEDPLEKE